MLSEAGKPLQTQRWAGAIDSVGGHTLANVLAQTQYGGTVASCGLAQSAELPATVMPFILRAVTLTGINSVFAPARAAREAWGQARHRPRSHPKMLDGMTETMSEASRMPPAVPRTCARGPGSRPDRRRRARIVPP